MSWLSSAFKKLRSPVGNLVKNVSPLLAFTPLGIPGAAIAGGLGEALRPGKNVGDIVKAGASNAAIGAGARGAVGLARSAFAPGSSAAGTVANAAAPSSSEWTIGGTLNKPYDGGGGSSMSSLLSGLKGAGRSALSAAKDNPLVVGQIASGVLGAREQGAQNQLQRDRFELERSMMEDEKKRREELARLLAPLYQQLMTSRTNVPANPYL